VRAGWLTHLYTKGFPSAVNLRPEGDHPERAHVAVDLPRVAAILNGLLPMSMSWPAPAAWPTWTPRRCWVTGGPNDGAGQQNRTWTSGSSAAAASCPSPSAPGTCSPLNATGAAKQASPPMRRTTRSVTASRARTHSTLPGGRVQQTGRFNAVPDTVLTDTPIPRKTRQPASSEPTPVRTGVLAGYARKAGPCPAAIGPHDAPPHAGQVVRRVLLRRNIVIDAETAQLVAAAVQAALQADAPSRPPRRGRRVHSAGCEPLF
jgi:hypothetical protein